MVTPALVGSFARVRSCQKYHLVGNPVTQFQCDLLIVNQISSHLQLAFPAQDKALFCLLLGLENIFYPPKTQNGSIFIIPLLST